LGFSISLKAQSNLAKPLFLHSFSNTLFITNLSPFLASHEKENSNISIFLPSIKHTAFFCVMEDKVYGKLNVWIKLRAGSDEIYRKMIATP
jgi:hypothetical protein